MSTIGEIRKGGEIGKRPYHNYIWQACKGCGKERWVKFIIKTGKPITLRCRPCAGKLQGYRSGKDAPSWKGGRTSNQGYIVVTLQPDDFFYSMAEHSGYVMEHRLVMAKHLGRCLQRWEVVHHKNGRRKDNRIENLELSVGIGDHIRNHSKGYRDGYAKGLIDGREKQIEELKQEIRLLRLRIGVPIT